MKVIDILNKIANGEEAPEKIKFGDNIYYRKTDANDGYVIDYLDIRDNSLFNFITGYKYCFIKSCLEWEIKDLEEKKKIPEKIKDKYCSQISKVELAQKYNEIIDYLKSKGE
jgi:hypothetical protein